MATSFLEAFPQEVRDWLSKQLSFLPPGSAFFIEKLLNRLPSLPRLLRDILDETYRSFTALVSEESPSVLIAGPCGAGKSTLVSTLTGGEEAYFSIGSETFPYLQSVIHTPFLLLDLPTFGASQTYPPFLSPVEQADLILLLWDYRGVHQIPSHPYVIQWLGQGKPLLWAVNKIDQGVPASEEVEKVQNLLSCEPIFLSAQCGTQLPQLLKRMVAMDPRLLNSFSRLRPEYRSSIIRSRIAQTVGLSAAVGWEPLPLADAIPLFLLQARMVLEIGRLYGFPVTLERVWELMGVFTGGMVLREGFHQLSKLLPFAGNALAMVYAAAGTAAIGFTAQKWFERGCQISERELQQIYQTAYQSYEKVFRALRPGGDPSSQIEALLHQEPQ